MAVQALVVIDGIVNATVFTVVPLESPHWEGMTASLIVYCAVVGTVVDEHHVLLAVSAQTTS